MEHVSGVQDRTGRWDISARIAERRFSSWGTKLCAAFMGRRFPSDGSPRLLIYYAPNRISYAQIYPFFHFGPDLRERLNLSVRARPVDEFINGRIETSADFIMVQPWFDVAPQVLAKALTRLRTDHPEARIIFVDSYAHNDLRLSGVLAGRIDLLIKKSLFVDRTEFLRPRAGDTNLVDYYGRLYNTRSEPTTPQMPAEFLDCLALSPGFLTAPNFIRSFLTGEISHVGERLIDVHARIEQKGTPWYSAMRGDAEASIRAIRGITLTPQGRIPLKMFLAELRQSKLCWSPFGYGELCWRDIEAFLTGSVLIKPNMSHLETRPDLFRAGETYLPVKWDFSDLEQVVRGALANADLRRHIAERAFSVCRDFLNSAAFTDQYAQLLFPAAAES